MRPTHLAFVIALALPGEALALQCFTVTPSGTAARPQESATLPVTFATAFRTSERCEYGLTPDPSGFTRAPAGETDFAALTQSLLRDARERHLPGASLDRPRTLYARLRGRTELESIFRETCSDGFFTDRQNFEARVDTRTGTLVISRPATVSTGDCGASETALRFVPIPQGTTPEALSAEPSPHVLDRGAREVDLGTTGEFAVYAARTPTAPGFLVGRLRRTDPLTALRRRFASTPSPERPWLLGGWTPEGALRLSRGPALADGPDARDAWSELVTASASGQLWLAEATPTNPGDVPRPPPETVHGSVEVSADGDAVVLPDALVREHLTARYGPAGASLVPTLGEWNELRGRLQLCLAERYGERLAHAPSTVPRGARCARFDAVLPAFTQPEGSVEGERSYCLQRSVRRLTARGAVADARLPEVCAPLSASGSATSGGVVTVATVHDRLGLRGAPDEHLYVCVDNRCEHLDVESYQRGLELRHSGLAEIRRATSPEAALAAQGVTLARFVVLDPSLDWLPVGLYTGAEGAPPADRWTALPHDEDDVFAYVRRRQTLAFELATSPTFAAVWNRPGAEALVTRHLPVVGGTRGVQPSPPPSGLVALVTRDGVCPTGSAASVRERPAIDPDALLIDQTFQVYLAQYAGEGAPYRCLARADFRVRESRAIAPTPWLHLGLLGDAQAVVFFTGPTAMGAALPVGFGYARLPWGFGVDASLSLTAAVTFDDAALTRVGAGLSLAAVWGPTRYVPRLVSVGLMLHLATGTHRDEEPVLSAYTALDLNALVDLAGGR